MIVIPAGSLALARRDTLARRLSPLDQAAVGERLGRAARADRVEFDAYDDWELWVQGVSE